MEVTASGASLLEAAFVTYQSVLAERFAGVDVTAFGQALATLRKR